MYCVSTYHKYNTYNYTQFAGTVQKKIRFIYILPYTENNNLPSLGQKPIHYYFDYYYYYYYFDYHLY